MGEARQEPGKVGCGALGCYDQGADGCLWAEQRCEALDTEDMVQATSMGMTVWWPQCDAGEEGVGGGRGQ